MASTAGSICFKNKNRGLTDLLIDPERILLVA